VRIPGGPRTVLLALAAAVIVCAVFALRLQASTGVDTLVNSGSADYQATQLDAQQFGSSSVVVLVKLPLNELIDQKQIQTVSELEACLDGQQ